MNPSAEMLAKGYNLFATCSQRSTKGKVWVTYTEESDL
jgi:hypothetical protein